MRGAPTSCAIGCSYFGIIPAYAGSTNRGRPAERPVGDHPRVCGEHSQAFREGRANSGSSPRMRGAQPVEIPSQLVDRIIPAYAGSTGRLV